MASRRLYLEKNTVYIKDHQGMKIGGRECTFSILTIIVLSKEENTNVIDAILGLYRLESTLPTATLLLTSPAYPRTLAIEFMVNLPYHDRR